MGSYHSYMGTNWVELEVLELFVAIVDEGSIGAGARTVGMAQPNASRLIAELEVRADTTLLDRSPRGSSPTEAGGVLGVRARAVLAAARELDDWIDTRRTAGEPRRLRVGASLTIADTLLPSWLAELRRRAPQLSADVTVLNSTQILDQVEDGALHIGFVETPYVPVRLNAMVVEEDELVVVIDPGHEWADKQGKVGVAELARTPLVVREEGSGTRDGLRQLLGGAVPVAPAQVLSSNAAVRVAVTAGAGPAVLSTLAVRPQLDSGELLRVPLDGPAVYRPLTAVWSGPHRLTGHTAELVRIAAASHAPGL